MSQFPRFHDARHIPVLLQNIDLVPRVNMALIGIILIEEDVIRFFQSVTLQENERAAQTQEGRLIYTGNRIECTADELVSDSSCSNYMWFLCQLGNKGFGQW